MSIYQHFRPEEREFIDQVLGWKNEVEMSYATKLTDFLDPREQIIVETIIGQHSDVKCRFFGGMDGSERKRALLYPDYLEPEDSDFRIDLFEINYPRKFVTLEHPAVLGSLMSLGLKRGKFGDILLDSDDIQLFVAEEISEYVRTQLTSIGKNNVSLTERPLEEAVQVKDKWVEQSATVSSLRLDTVVSGLYRISRQKSQLLVQQKHVKVNWTVIESSSFECGEGDVISVRRFGRVKIIALEGKTKKDKWKITYGLHK